MFLLFIFLFFKRCVCKIFFCCFEFYLDCYSNLGNFYRLGCLFYYVFYDRKWMWNIIEEVDVGIIM